MPDVGQTPLHPQLNHPKGGCITPLRRFKVSPMQPTVRTPVSIALVDDYDIVVMGIAHILQQYQDRVVIAELDSMKRPRFDAASF
jgi:hypothetical protein